MKTEAGHAIIGRILNTQNGEAEIYFRCLLPEYFPDRQDALTFEAASSLAREGIPPNALNLANSGKLGNNAEVRLVELGNAHSGFEDAGILIRCLVEEWGKRQIRDLGERSTKADFFDLLQQLDCLSMSIGRAVTALERRSKESQVQAVDRYFQDKRAGRIRMISTGWPSLDGPLKGGLSDSGLSYLVAPAGFGKTSFALAVAIHAARFGFPVHFIQGEMTEAQMHRRATLITQGADPEIDAGAWARWIADYLHKLPLRIEVLTERTPSGAIRECQQAAADGARLIVLDYLQVFSELSGERIVDASKEFLAIRHLSRRLRQFALKTGAHVLAISARNRNEDGRRPTLSTLYGGTGLEHDCTEAFILRRYADTLTEYDDAEKKRRLEAVEQERAVCPMILDIAKARDAITGPLRFTYNKQTQRFCEGWPDGINA